MAGSNFALAGMTLAISTTPENSSLDLAGFGALTYDPMTSFIDIGAHGYESNVIRQTLADGRVLKGRGTSALTDIPITASKAEVDTGRDAFEAASDPSNGNCYAIRYTDPDGSIEYYRGFIDGFQSSGGDGDASNTVTFNIAAIQQVKA